MKPQRKNADIHIWASKTVQTFLKVEGTVVGSGYVILSFFVQCEKETSLLDGV